MQPMKELCGVAVYAFVLSLVFVLSGYSGNASVICSLPFSSGQIYPSSSGSRSNSQTATEEFSAVSGLS